MVDTVEDDSSPHLRSNDVFVSGVGHSCQKFIKGWIGGQGQSCKGVHDQVDPEHLNWGQRGFLQNWGAHKGHHNGYSVNGQLELKELPDTIEYISTILNSSDDGAEVVIEKNDTSCFFGNLGSSNTHSKSNVSFFEGRSIIGTITCHSYDILELLEASGQDIFILGWWSGKNSEFISDLFEFIDVFDNIFGFWFFLTSFIIFIFTITFIIFIIFVNFNFDESLDQSSKLLSFHDSVVILHAFNCGSCEMWGEDLSLFSNGGGCFCVITCHHSDDNTCIFAVLDCFWNWFLERILDTSDTNHYQIIFKVLRIIGFGFFSSYFFIADKDGPQRIRREETDDSSKLFSEGAINRSHIAWFIEVVFAAFEKDFRSTFGEDVVFIVLFLLIYHRHSLSVWTERNSINGFYLSPDIFKVIAQVVCHFKKGALGFISNLLKFTSFSDWMSIWVQSQTIS